MPIGVLYLRVKRFANMAAANTRHRHKLSAARMTRYRHRRRNGLAVFTVQVHKKELIWALRLARGLSANPSRKQIEESLSRMLEQFAARWQRYRL